MPLAPYGYALIVTYPDTSIIAYGWSVDPNLLEPAKPLALENAMELWDGDADALSACIVPAASLSLVYRADGAFEVEKRQKVDGGAALITYLS